MTDHPANYHPVDTRIVTWGEVHRDTRLLVRRLLAQGPWKGIVALTRGGLVPAAIVAREMDIRAVETLCIASYDEARQGSVQVLKEATAAGDGAGWLLIDDLVDTGATARVARRALPRAHFATLYAKPQGRPLVDTYVAEVAQETWIYFPWDTDVGYAAPLVKGA